MKKIVLVFIFYFGPFLSAIAAQEPFKIDLYVDIPTRDGTVLSGRIWHSDANMKVPTILLMTPYTTDDSQARGSFFAQNGYAFIAVNQRGRGESAGEFTPLQNIAHDGCDVIDWIKRQAWSDGRVVMNGGSYRGMAQWQIAAKCSEKLSAIAPVASVYPGEDFPTVRNEIYMGYPIHWLAFVSGRTSNRNLFGDNDYYRSKIAKISNGDRPFADLDELYGLDTPYFDLWLNQIGDGSLWDKDNPTAEEMANIDLPILTITGHFDSDQPGALRYYREHMAAARQHARENHFLVMGPWHHGATRRPVKEFGGLTFGENSLIDMNQLHLDFYNWALNGSEKPPQLKDNVTYYAMHINEWRSASVLEDIHTRELTFYLSGQAIEAPETLIPGFAALDTLSEVEATIEFKSNPAQLPERSKSADNFKTHPKIIDLRDSFYVQSPPLDEAVTLSGQWQLVLYMEMDVPDADVTAGMTILNPDGTALNINGTIKRARFREGAHKEKLIEAGEILEYRFEPAAWHSAMLVAGSRFRVQIAPATYPGIQLNMNSGKKLGYETKDDARVANIKVHTGKAYPSRIIVPIE